MNIVTQQEDKNGRSQPLTFENLMSRMSITKAAKRMGISATKIRGAIERGEMKYIRMPDSKRKYVTPAFVADWVSEYCVHQEAGIASAP